MKEICCSRWHEVKWKIAQKFLIFMTVTKRDIRHNWKMLCKTVSIIQQCHTCRDQTCCLKLGFTPSNNYVNWFLVLTVTHTDLKTTEFWLSFIIVPIFYATSFLTFISFTYALVVVRWEENMPNDITTKTDPQKIWHKQKRLMTRQP